MAIKIRPLCCIKVVPDPPPPPVGDYDYRLDLGGDQPTLYLNTVCFNRLQEGWGNCYSDPACTNELYNLEDWDSSTPDTAITGVYDSNYNFYVYSIYLKNVNLPPSTSVGTIVAANDSNVYWQWLGGTVYDSNNQPVSQGIVSPGYNGAWVDITYTVHSTACPDCGGTGLVTDTCSRCGGSGEDPYDGHNETCPNCNGTGLNPGGGWEDTCSECGGSGMVDYGEGEETCHTCNGSGMEIFNYCAECGGEGTVWVGDTCSECGGSGEITSTCNTCGGDGDIGD